MPPPHPAYPPAHLPTHPPAASTPHTADRPRALRPDLSPIGPEAFQPTARRPLRVRARHLDADTHVQPHEHPWAQVAYSATGVLRVTTTDSTYIVPPSRAVWLPPGLQHAVTVVEDADLRTLYLHQTPRRIGPLWRGQRSSPDDLRWHDGRVLEVSPLLRELVESLAATEQAGRQPSPDPAREQRLGMLVLDELRRAHSLRLGVDLPRDKRLRALCEAVLLDPARHDTLQAWTQGVGISARTATRLFRDELGTSFVQWRQQVLLAKALSLAARKRPMSHIAAELGYASPSAFTAMVRRSVGAPPSRFFAMQG